MAGVILEIILLLIFFILVYLLVFKRSASVLNDIPGPKNLPIVGSLFKISATKPYISFTELSKTYGDVYRISLGGLEFVVISGYNTLTDALCGQIIEFAGRPNLSLFKAMADSGLFVFMDYSPSWKLYRKLTVRSINHIVSPHNHTHEYITSVEKICNLFEKTMRENEGKPYDPISDIRNIMFLFVSSFNFGQNFTQLDDTILRHFQGEKENAKLLIMFMLYDFFPIFKLFLKTDNYFKKLLDEEIQSMDKMLKERLKMNREDKIACACEAFLEYAEQSDLITESGEKISYEEILKLLFTLFTAGVDTTTTYLSFCFFYLCAFPHLQLEIQQEMDQTLPADKFPSLEDVQKLVKLHSVMLEIERHSCFAPIGLPKAITKDVIFKSFYLPKGTPIIPNMYSAHFDPSQWINPEKFDPSRFLNSDNTVDVNNSNKIMIFGGGRRRCPGQYLARKNVSMILTTLLRNFNVKSASDDAIDLNDVTFDLFLHPKRFKVILSCRSK